MAIINIVDSAEGILSAIGASAEAGGIYVETGAPLGASEFEVWLAQNGFVQATKYGNWVKPVQGVTSVGETATAQYGLATYETSIVESAGGYTTSVTPLAGEGLEEVYGGVTMGVKIAQLAGAVAIGAGIGLKSYHDYPEFWTDLSESLFDGIGGDEVMPVIMRAVEGGGLKTYARKQDIDTIIKNLYELTPLETTTTSDVNRTGVFTFASGGVGFEYVAMAYNNLMQSDPIPAVISMSDLKTRYGYILGKYIENYGKSPNLISVSAQHNEYRGRIITAIAIRFYDYTEPTINIRGESGSYYGHNTEYGFGANVIYESDGSFWEIEGEGVYGGDNLYVQPYKQSDSFWQFSSLLNTVKSPAPAVIEKNDTTLAPSPALFWDVFSDWRDKGFTKHNYNPQTGEDDEEYWIPITIPTIDPNTDVDGDQDDTQDGLQEDPSPILEATDPVIPLIPNITIPPTPTPTPPSPVPPISAFDGNQALWSVYNPTLSEVHGVGSFLWTENIINIIQQVFKNNPLDAVISLHQIYVTPTTNGRKNIKLGYVDTNVSSKVVSKQYETIDCGTLTIPEYFGDTRDYTSTKVEIYLPFIGIRSLSTCDVVGSKVNVVYVVDVYTGVIIAQIWITKSGIRQCLYQFEGNCSVQIPLTSADRTRLVSGVANTVISTITGGAMGGAGGALLGGIGAMANSLTNPASIERTCNLSGNGGAMAIKKPYLLITSKIPTNIGAYKHNFGAPACFTSALASCKGFTKVRDCHLDGLNCTDREKNELYSLLKNGVIL